MNIAIWLLSTSILMAVVVLVDIAIPNGAVRFDREAFYFYWPSAEIVTRNGLFCREFHIILFGYEYHIAYLDYLWLPDSGTKVRSFGWMQKR